jgi:hypothetical protein
MSNPPSGAGRPRRLPRVLAYYVVLALALFLVSRYAPAVEGLLRIGSGSAVNAEDVFGPSAPPPVGSEIGATPWAGALVGVVSMLGALVIMIPVTWVYLITRGERGFNESVVHTLLILPVAVSGIVLILQDSVPLAFSLAGIVAAVRFRTTLEDTKDAVYVFLAIGVGLASGAQALGVALVLSIVFNGVILALWKTRFGNAYSARGPGGVQLSEALAGIGGSATQIVGDAALVDAASPAELGEVLDRAARMERHISEERTLKKRERANALLLVYATAAGPAQQVVELVLEELAARWKLAEITPAGPGRFVLEYLVRLDAPGAQGIVLDRVAKADPEHVDAAEIRSLKGLKKRS